MIVCGSCGIGVNNLGRHKSRNRCKEQHIRKKIKQLTPRQRQILEDAKNERPKED